jgi:hypothetical protein
MREKEIEQYLREEVKKLGGKAYKFVSPGSQGVPDRLVCLPGGRIYFVELKAPGKTSSPMQYKQQADLRRLGCQVYEDVSSMDRVDNLIRFWREGQ